MGRERRGNFWLGFFFGGFLGTILIFLLGTKEGRKVAKKLLEKGEEISGDLEKKLKEIEKEGKKVVKKVEKVKKGVVKKAEKQEKETQKKINDVLAKAEDLQEKSLQKTAELRRYFTRSGKKLTSSFRSN